MRTRTLFALLTLAVIASACLGTETAPAGNQAAPTTTVVTTPTTVSPAGDADSDVSEPEANASDSTATPGEIALVITDCAGASDEFELFCEAYDIVQSAFVDELDPADLANGAVEGLEAFDAELTDPAPSQVSCAAPTDDFNTFCEAFASRTLDDVSQEDLVEAAIRGMMDFGLEDPNSNYLPPEALELSRTDTSGQIEGIGALVQGTNLEAGEDESPICSELSATCKLQIVTPLDGSPAEAAGILPGDFIVEVNGESVEGQFVDAVVLQVRGPAGSEVLLGIERNGEILDITIVRAPIIVPIVVTEMLTDTVGYLSLAQFTATSPDLVEDGLAELLEAGAESIIFDLQNNPGGLLDASVEIASEFIGSGLILTTEAPDQTIEFDALSGGIATSANIEVYVLMNRGSASASEVVAGALQDTGRAIIVGENSFGKNTVQRQFLLSNGGALKVTIARWATPAGNDYGIVGLTPDVEVDLPDDLFDRQLAIDAALDLIANS